MKDCLFCKISQGEIPAQIVYEDDQCIAFRDVNPVAPIHVLIIPREHISGIAAVTNAQQALLGHLLLVARRIAQDLGGEENGYRLVLNNGVQAGQTVFHLHIHLLAGRQLGWPPG
ncbi:MAG: histidine triad nucleotide-binding protein [Heliobacteriaceae bacterium]|nr:histidine triad nucleotide-binding protein [Heliobacteriaceae bacterium]MDD4586862.1 histidine triad nucleotide-binding protein [Heliobacteriaceae bacterium]